MFLREYLWTEKSMDIQYPDDCLIVSIEGEEIIPDGSIPLFHSKFNSISVVPARTPAQDSHFGQIARDGSKSSDLTPSTHAYQA